MGKKKKVFCAGKFFTENVNDECEICCVDLVGNDEVSQVYTCGHVFHRNCMRSWMDTCARTPLTRPYLVCPVCNEAVLFVKQLLWSEVQPMYAGLRGETYRRYLRREKDESFINGVNAENQRLGEERSRFTVIIEKLQKELNVQQRHSNQLEDQLTVQTNLLGAAIQLILGDDAEDMTRNISLRNRLSDMVRHRVIQRQANNNNRDKKRSRDDE